MTIKIEKSKPFEHIDILTDSDNQQIDNQTDIQIDRQTDRQIDRLTD